MKKLGLIIVGAIVALALIGIMFGSDTTSQQAQEPAGQADPIPALIEQRYAECVPGLEADDIQRVSDTRYTWSAPDAEWILAWTIGAKNAETGEPFTAPTDDSMSQFEKLGCV